MKSVCRGRSLLGLNIAAIALISLIFSTAEAAKSVKDRWDEFHSDPVRAMNSPPPKTLRPGKSKPVQVFSPQEATSRSFVEKKNRARLGDLNQPICDELGVCLRDIIEGRAAAKQNVSDFFDQTEFKNKKIILKLDEMEAVNLKEAELDETPWSDTYWPIYQGLLGSRFGDGNFKRAGNWKGHYDFILNKSQSLKSIADSGSALALDLLSPSEKYDLLIGDLTEGRTVYENGYLTPVMWEEGSLYWDRYSEVEAWMGICDGWAKASFRTPRPTKSIEVASADGTKQLKFYPSDIKGLTSYMWAKSQSTPSRFIGGRCNDKEAKADPDTGRITDEACFDTNPANWHHIVVNQIGVAKKSFVMDATFDYEVWNHPLTAYSYSYFNPATGETTDTLASAVIDVASFKNDKFKKFRSKKTAYVVGINMVVTYVVETEPSHSDTDGPEYDATSTADYMYDLELDKDMNVIGGEWYTNLHPDFLWSPVADARPSSVGDSLVKGSWNADEPLPKFWQDIAIRTALENKLPVFGIVEALIEKSNRP